MGFINTRTVVGFLVAPAVPGSMVLTFAALSGKFAEGAWAFLFGAVVAYATVIVLGLPVYFLMRRFRLNSMWMYLLVGALMGLTAYLFLAPPNWMVGPEMPEGAVFFLLLAVGSGFAAAGAFWGIVRPDTSK